MNILRRRWVMDRRTFLRGTGAAIALPWLEAMGVYSASYSKAGELASGEIPPRTVFTFWGMGMNPFTATPKQTGLDYILPESVKPLEPFRKHVTIVSGLRNKPAETPEPHAYIEQGWLTCVKPMEFGKGGPDSGEKFVHTERLGDKIIGPQIERIHFRRLVAPAGQNDDRHRRFLSQPEAYLASVAVGQPQVQHDEIRATLCERLESIVRRHRAFNFIASQREEQGEALLKQWVVVHYEDSGRSHQTCLETRPEEVHIGRSTNPINVLPVGCL